MTDDDLAAQVEQLRARQDQADQSLVALAEVIASLIDEARRSSAGTPAAAITLGGLSRTVSTVQQDHRGHHGK